MQNLNKNSSLHAWLSFFEQPANHRIEFGLSRVKAVAKRLGVDKTDALVITVAGTNGKGSTCKLLESALIASGYAVGCFISPHLLRFNERINIKGQVISDADLVKRFAQIREAQGEIVLTYFEFAILAALCAFNEESLDVFVLEVGLGGRLDAVNLLDADLAIITSIALDHIEYLGNNREDIAKEKLGIVRKNKTLVCGDFSPPLVIKKTVDKLNINYLRIRKNFAYVKYSTHIKLIANKKRTLKLKETFLPETSYATAWQTLCISGLKLNQNKIKQAWDGYKLKGRLEYFKWGRHTIICDVAHNAAAAKLLTHKIKAKPVSIICGMKQNKDFSAFANELIKISNDWHLVKLPPNSALSPKAMQRELNKKGVVNCIHSLVSQALEFCLKREEPQTILVCGSFVTVNLALKYLAAKK